MSVGSSESEALDSLRALAVPLHTLDPADPDISDLAAVGDLVGDARVVSIGESAHGVREFYQLKDRLLRYLVSERGFTAFVMESGFPEGLAVNDWVLGGAGTLDPVADTGITYGFGRCAEMRAQLQWMRDWNATRDSKVRFYGMDVAGSIANPGPGVAICQARLAPAPGDAALRELAELGEQFEARARYAGMAPLDRARLSNGIAALAQRSRDSGDDVTERCGRAVAYLDGLLSGALVYTGDRNPRDELMADTVRWILEREERIVIGAHNGHIQRSSQYGATLGQMLAPVLGDEMVVIGTTYASGDLQRVQVLDEATTRFSVGLEAIQPSPQSIDALMDRVGPPLHLVDLRGMSEAQLGGARQMLFNHDVYDFAPKGAFDALIHVRHVTSVDGLVEASRASIARAESLA